MRIGKYEIGRTGFHEAVLNADATHGKGIFGATPATVYKVKDIVARYELYQKHDLVRGMIDDLAESACGQGYYNTVETETPVLKKSKPRDLVDDLGEFHNLDEKFPMIAKNILIAGFCPVESIIVSDPEKCAFKIVHPKTVTDIETDPVSGEVTKIKQKVGSNENTILGDKLAWFSYGNLANDPRGISFIESCGDILAILDDTTNIIKNITNRYVAPIAIWKSRQSGDALKKAVQARAEGEDIFLGSQTIEEMNQKTVEFVSIDPRVPFWEFMENLQVRLYSYSRASNLWMTKNANLASAEKLEDIVARHVNAIQRGIKRSAEKYWYRKIIELNNYEEVPRITFGKEPTGVEDITPSDIITKGLELGYINQAQYFEILKQAGIKVSEELATEPEKPEDETEKEPETQEPEETSGETSKEKDATAKDGKDFSTKEFREAMPETENNAPPKLLFEGKITGSVIDPSYYRPKTKYSTEEKQL